MEDSLSNLPELFGRTYMEKLLILIPNPAGMNHRNPFHLIISNLIARARPFGTCQIIRYLTTE